MLKKYNFEAYLALNRKYKHVKLRMDGTLKILTPEPYILKSFDRENIDDVIYMYEEDVKFLNNCLLVLDITKREARLLKYGLNKKTGNELYNRALHNDNVSYEFTKIICNYHW